VFDAEDCRANAARCAELATCAADPADREIWVQIAYGWLAMAADIERGAAPSMATPKGGRRVS
jgi:hypothetical protein